MLDEFAFLGEDVAYEIVVKTPMILRNALKIEVVKKICTRLSLKIRRTCCRDDLSKAFEIYGNPLPDIVDRRIEKELTSILGNGFAVITWHHKCLLSAQINVVIWLVRVDLLGQVLLRQ